MDLRERAVPGSDPEDRARRHPWEVARARFFRRLVAQHCPAPATVVDIGAGDGWFAEQLRHDLPVASTIVCCDTHYTDDDLAASLPEGIVRTRTTPAAPAALVLALDVLEHVDDDAAFLRDEVRPRVAGDGTLIVSVPAHQSLFTSHDTALGHYRRHDAASMRRLLAPDFDIMIDGALFTSLLLPRAVSALAERMRPPKGPAQVDSDWDHGPFVSRCVTAVLDADAATGRWLAGRRVRPPGLSVWAVCRPKVSTPS